MKSNHLSIVAASLILGISIITGCWLISSEQAESREQVMESRNEAASAEGPLLTLQETADLLKLTEEQVMNIIKAEHAILSNNGVFTGTMLPYIKVDDQFRFSGAGLQTWVQQATAEERIYSGIKMLK